MSVLSLDSAATTSLQRVFPGLAAYLRWGLSRDLMCYLSFHYSFRRGLYAIGFCVCICHCSLVFWLLEILSCGSILIPCGLASYRWAKYIGIGRLIDHIILLVYDSP